MQRVGHCLVKFGDSVSHASHLPSDFESVILSSVTADSEEIGSFVPLLVAYLTSTTKVKA